MDQDQGTAALDAEASAGGVPMPAFLPPRLQLPRLLRQDPPEAVHELQTPTEETEHGRPIDPTADGSGFDVRDVPTTDGPSPASTGKPFRPLATRAQVEAAKRLMGAILMGATGLMNRRVAVHDGDRRWLMEPDDRDAIAAPLARIVARHSPVAVDGESASDLADGIEAVTALIGFVLEQVQADPGPAPVILQATAEPSPTTSPADANPFQNPAYQVLPQGA